MVLLYTGKAVRALKNGAMEQLANFVTHITGSNILARILIAIAVALLVWLICHVLIKATQRLLNLENTSISQTTIIVNIVRIVVWSVAICFIADVCFDVNMTAIIAALGVGGIAISLGFQNTLSNLFGGIQITLMHVIQPGDNVSIGSTQGVVQDINWSYTTLQNSNGEPVIVPNSVIASTAVVHLPPLEKVSVPIVVTKDLDDLDGLAAQVEKAALDAASSITRVVQDPVVSFNKVASEGLFGTIKLIVDDGSKATDVSDAITRAVAPLIQTDVCFTKLSQ